MVQNNWRWCSKCQGLFFAGNSNLGTCPAGGAHSNTPSSDYMIMDDSTTSTGQDNWRWCKNCQGLFFAGDVNLGRCPAGGAHSNTPSGNYLITSSEKSSRAVWRWCKNCQGLFAAGNASLGVCPAGGVHSDTPSSHYIIQEWSTMTVDIASWNGMVLAQFSAQWNGGATEYSRLTPWADRKFLTGYASPPPYITRIIMSGPPVGTSCWLRAKVDVFGGIGTKNHDSGDNFAYTPGGYVAYDFTGGVSNPSFDEKIFLKTMPK